MLHFNLFQEQNPLNYPEERSISAWKTIQEKINGRDYITIREGSDGNQKFIDKTFEVIRFRCDREKIVFNCNRPVERSKLESPALALKKS